MKKVLLFLLLAFTTIPALNAQERELKFNKDRRFKIVQFTDVHWVYGNDASQEAATLMAEVLVGSTDEVLDAGFIIDEDGPEDIMDVFGDVADADADSYED